MQNNAGLCGAIPDCLVNRVPELEGTGLMDPRNASANPAGGVCDESPPSCLPEHGCRWAELCHRFHATCLWQLLGSCLTMTV